MCKVGMGMENHTDILYIKAHFLYRLQKHILYVGIAGVK